MNEEEFYQLVERHKDMLWYVCSDYRLSGAWEIRDAMQEVLCALWKDLPKLRKKESERIWVYRVATHTMLTISRKRHNQPTDPLPSDILQWAGDDSDAATGDRRYLTELIDQMGDTDRRIMRAYIDGFSLKNIAKMLEMSEDMVYKRYNRAIKKLRQRYED